MTLLSQEPLSIEDLNGARPDQRILRLKGPVVLSTLFQFQSTLRARDSRALVLDFTGVPYMDSAGIGALVGAYVTHNKDGRSLALVGVNDLIHAALQVTRVEQFFRFFNTPPKPNRYNSPNKSPSSPSTRHPEHSEGPACSRHPHEPRVPHPNVALFATLRVGINESSVLVLEIPSREPRHSEAAINFQPQIAAGAALRPNPNPDLQS